MDTILNGSSVKGFLVLIEVHLFYLNHLIIIVFSITGVPNQKRECGGLFEPFNYHYLLNYRSARSKERMWWLVPEEDGHL